MEHIWWIRRQTFGKFLSGASLVNTTEQRPQQFSSPPSSLTQTGERFSNSCRLWVFATEKCGAASGKICALLCQEIFGTGRTLLFNRNVATEKYGNEIKWVCCVIVQ